MESDRELLDLAAKAIGRTLNWADAERNPKYSPRLSSHGMWNPLRDDGDALCLAVQLQLNVNNEHVSAGAAYCTRGEDEVYPTASSGIECHGPAADHVIPEDYVATRLAIVLAAAEIGRSMT